MTETPTPPSDPQPAAQEQGSGTPRWVIPVLVGAGVAIVALVFAVVFLAGGSDDGADEKAGADSSSSTEEAETFTASGHMTLIDSGVETFQDECFGSGGYDDMAAGTQVVIRDADGKTVAVGELGPGTPESSVTCVFTFNVRDVPAGSNIYSVEISHRGEISFSPDEAENLELSLG